MAKKLKKNSKDYVWLMSTLVPDSIYQFVNGRYDLTEAEYKQYRDSNAFVVDKIESKKYTTYALYVDKYATVESKSKKPNKKRKRKSK